MNLIHRHIFLHVLGTCALAVAMFAAVLMAGNALRELIAPALSGQLPIDLLLRLLGLMVPVVATYAYYEWSAYRNPHTSGAGATILLLMILVFVLGYLKLAEANQEDND